MRGALIASAGASALLATVALMAPGPAASARSASVAPWRHACGWIVNPTPANWSLVDRFGEWELGVQGGHQAIGLDEMPDLTAHDWQAENGSYGQGCACMDILAQGKSHRVARLRAIRQLPLKTCRTDPALKSR